jgi:membrane peptidoglycan carboxypeptidase
VQRRDYVLRNLATSRWTHLTPEELQAALDEPVILAGPQPQVMLAPHFDWAVRAQLEQLFGGPDAVETGGYRVITTLDWKAQQLAERYMTAAAIIPNLPKAAGDKLIASMGFSKADRTWIRALRGKDIHDGAVVAVDYRHGDVIAYVGSAGYYRQDLASPKFSPQYDAAAAGRQPGSAFKAIVYTTAFNQKVLTPGSVLLDVSTDFGGGWAPKDADTLERGPVLVRGAIQQSLNLPAIRALQRVGNAPVADVADKLGITFTGGRTAFMQAGLAAAIGTVETRPIDLAAAFGSLGNGGAHVPTRMILSITKPDGTAAFTAPDPAPVQAVSPQAAFLTTDILAGNTDPAQNSWWAATLALHNGPGGSRRPAAAKTGTADNRRDFSTYGFLAPPADPSAPAIAVGVWMGNSDHSAPRTKVQATSLTTAGQVWHSFLRDYTAKWPVGRRPGAVDARDGQGVVHRRHPARCQARDRPAGSALYPGLWRLDGRSRQGGARAGALARRRPKLARARPSRPRGEGTARIHHGVLVRGLVLGWPARGAVPRSVRQRRRQWPRPRSWGRRWYPSSEPNPDPGPDCLAAAAACQPERRLAPHENGRATHGRATSARRQPAAQSRWPRRPGSPPGGASRPR